MPPTRSTRTAEIEKLHLAGFSIEAIVRETGSPIGVVKVCVTRIENVMRSRLSNTPLTDEGIRNQIQAWIRRNGLPCNPRRWTDLSVPGQVSAMTIIRRYGSWAKAMRTLKIRAS